MHEVKPASEVRVADRLPIGLQVFAGEHKAKSANSISETGVLIEGYQGLEVQVGEIVRVMTRSVISNDDSGYHLSNMYIVRINGSQLALSSIDISESE